MGKGPYFKFWKGEAKVSHKPAEPWLPEAQNNPHLKVAHSQGVELGGEYLEPLQCYDETFEKNEI